MTERELVQLEREARKPDYGAKYYKPATVLALIEELRKKQGVITMMQTELELARRVADAAAAFDIVHSAANKVGELRETHCSRRVRSAEDAVALTHLWNAEREAAFALDEAFREYRAHIEAAAFMARPEVRRPLDKLGEMEGEDASRD